MPRLIDQFYATEGEELRTKEAESVTGIVGCGLLLSIPV